jgi:hypothetical protein
VSMRRIGFADGRIKNESVFRLMAPRTREAIESAPRSRLFL